MVTVSTLNSLAMNIRKERRYHLAKAALFCGCTDVLTFERGYAKITIPNYFPDIKYDKKLKEFYCLDLNEPVGNGRKAVAAAAGGT